MRPVNLIPAEDRRRGVQTAPIAYLLVGALVAALAAVTLVVLADNKIADRKSRITELRQEQAAVISQAEQLTPFVEFSETERDRTQTIRSLANSRFDWERVLRELSLVLPGDVSLTTLSASTASADVTTDPLAAAAASPSLQLSGCAGGHEGVAGFLGALRDIDGVDSVNLSASNRSGGETSESADPSAVGAEGCAPNETKFELAATFGSVSAAAGLAAPTTTEAAPTSAATDGTGS